MRYIIIPLAIILYIIWSYNAIEELKLPRAKYFISDGTAVWILLTLLLFGVPFVYLSINYW